MSRWRAAHWLALAWLGAAAAGIVHPLLTEPSGQMPVYHFNRLVIAAAWFCVALVPALALLPARRGLPDGDRLRALAVVPVLVQTVLAVALLVAVFG